MNASPSSAPDFIFSVTDVKCNRVYFFLFVSLCPCVLKSAMMAVFKSLEADQCK